MPGPIRRALAAFVLAGCSSAPSAPDAGQVRSRPDGVELCYTELSSTHPATIGFRTALSEGRAADRMAALTALEAAAKEHPREEQLALLSGLAHLWRLAGPLPSEQGDQTVILQSATAARRELERAYALCPTDHRIPAWLGPILVSTGRALGSQQLVDEGMAVLERGIRRYPAFVLFSKLLVYADRPASDPEFREALQAVEANTQACAGDGPLGLSWDPACTNGPTAHHNIEGASVFLGDAYTKAGRVDEARNVYEQARGSPDYAEWDWQALLDQRIATVADRAVRYGNADPKDDPEAIWQASYQCSICHQR